MDTAPKRVRTNRARGWCMTLNNWSEDDMQKVSDFFKKQKWWIVAKEVGDNGTPHIQAYFYAKNPIEFNSLKTAFPNAHWEKARGSAQDNRTYCAKGGDFVTNIDRVLTLEMLNGEILTAEYKDVEWRPWQQKVLDLITAPADPRKIHWIYDPVGNTGKSYLVKFIALTFNAIIADGCKKDVFHAVASYFDAKKKAPGKMFDCILLDIPRSAKDYLGSLYGTLEKLKDGCIYSGKYEGSQVTYPIRPVLVFANFEPDYDQWSNDRYDVINVY